MASLLLCGCSSDSVSKPGLPQSVSPGWKLASFGSAAKPGDIAGDDPAACWKADYTGQGTVEVWICRYRAAGSAFDAAQRSRTAAQTVKFNVGNSMVLAKWNMAPKASLTALIREIQKSLH